MYNSQGWKILTISKVKYCSSCGKKIQNPTESQINYCSFCGIKLKKGSITSRPTVQCTICHNYIGLRNSNTIKCPFCGSQYHSKCIISWIRKHNSCPLCLNTFTTPEKVSTQVIY